MAVFDAFAIDYDNWYEEKKGKFVDMVETMLAMDMLDVQEDMRILDVGCGTGNFSVKLAQAGCKVTGIDVSDEMLDIAREKAEQQGLEIEFLKMDAEDIGFKDDTFDAAVSMAAFEFIKNTEMAFIEMLRVTKRGGAILIGSINKESPWGKLYTEKSISEKTVFKYADFKSKRDFRQLFPSLLKDIRECLFVPPMSDETDFDMEKEKEFSKDKEGGYICALWKK